MTETKNDSARELSEEDRKLVELVEQKRHEQRAIIEQCGCDQCRKLLEGKDTP